MNRQDKIQKKFDKRLKSARAKLNTKPKERYICKADRAKIESQNAEIASSTEESESL